MRPTYCQPSLSVKEQTAHCPMGETVAPLLLSSHAFLLYPDCTRSYLVGNSRVNHVFQGEAIISSVFVACSESRFRWGKLSSSLRSEFCWELSIFVALIASFMLEIIDSVFRKLPCLGQQRL